MQKHSLNLNWRFRESNRMGTLPGAGGPVSKTINLPHDFIYTKPRDKDAVGASPNGYFGEGRGIYEKTLEIPEEWIGKRIILDIDGAYMNAEISLNRELLAMHPYGYTPYLVDLSDHVRPGKNYLVITTQSRQPSTRWYSGGGLYRGVSLWVGQPVGIEPWDIFVSTLEVLKGRAIIEAEVAISTLHHVRGSAVIQMEAVDADGEVAASGQILSAVVPGEKVKSKIRMEIRDPKLWSPDAPNLYTLRTTVRVDGQDDETAETVFGIRKYEVDAVNGLRLNGEPIKLKGGCIHHDHAFLGSAAWPRAEERKIQILKAAGYNAVRISHYPPSLAMLEACDREGIILLDEAFDCWRIGKCALDYHLYFEEWWERDIEYMVLRDRNHPCVFSYSIGNEIGERDGSGDGYYWAHKLADKIRSLDSTHYITSALCGIFDAEAYEEALKEAGDPEKVNMQNLPQRSTGRDNWGEKTADYASALDIVGYNYLVQRYESDRTKFPGRVIMGTETFPFTTYDFWKATMENSHVIGDFIWTAYDNLGEAGVGRVVWDKSGEDHGFMGQYPWRSCFQGDMDLCGYRTGQSYYREIMWEAFDGHSDKMALFTTHPCHYGDSFWGTGWHWRDVEDTWTFGDEWRGTPAKVDAYADADEVEFFLNGVSVGKAPVVKLEASLEIPYEKGILEAVAYRDGKETARCSLKTAGEACAVTLCADRSEIRADSQDLSYVALTLVDENGDRVPYETSTLHIEVSGAGRLAGIGSGNPCTEEGFGDPFCKAYQGRAMAAVVADAPGEILVKAWAEGMVPAEITIQAR
ncbi:MAG: DUF4982 domain-containing protein [Firmicutes bacterium]|nr:DUF4982 domain-containing protein [Bacillota bacterium]